MDWGKFTSKKIKNQAVVSLLLLSLSGSPLLPKCLPFLSLGMSLLFFFPFLLVAWSSLRARGGERGGMIGHCFLLLLLMAFIWMSRKSYQVIHCSFLRKRREILKRAGGRNGGRDLQGWIVRFLLLSPIFGKGTRKNRKSS